MAMSGNPMSFGGNTPFGSFAAGLPGLLQGFFGNSGKPFREATKAYTPWLNKAEGTQNPFYSAGAGALPDIQQWLNKMKNPGDFINQTMSGYQQSPWAQNLQKASERAGINAASVGGLPGGAGGAGIGSTPFVQQAQQNAGEISSADMNSWLQHVLGINTEYGAGLNNLAGFGQHSADQLSNLYGNAGENFGNAAFGEEEGRQHDQNMIWASIAKMFGG